MHNFTFMILIHQITYIFGQISKIIIVCLHSFCQKYLLLVLTVERLLNYNLDIKLNGCSTEIMEGYIMKKSFKLVGLGCANCAAKMENAISKLPEVSSVSINFLTTRMTIEAEREQMDAIIAAAQKIVKNYEPDVKIEKA